MTRRASPSLALSAVQAKSVRERGSTETPQLATLERPATCGHTTASGQPTAGQQIISSVGGSYRGCPRGNGVKVAVGPAVIPCEIPVVGGHWTSDGYCQHRRDWGRGPLVVLSADIANLCRTLVACQ